MTKKICNTAFTKDLSLPQFEVLKFIQQGLNLTQIGKTRHTTRQAVRDILLTLINKSLISNPKKGMYELTSKGITFTEENLKILGEPKIGDEITISREVKMEEKKDVKN